MDMDKVKTITLAVIAVALLFIGYSLFQISQNGRYISPANSRLIQDSRTGHLYERKRMEVDSVVYLRPQLPPK